MANEPNLALAVEKESRKRLADLLQTIALIHDTPFEHKEEPVCVFHCGSARLLDYGCKNPQAPIVFLIPSLINRYTILDLTENVSFAKYLRDEGNHVFIVDWNEPSSFEEHFNTSLYITEILIPMTEWIKSHYDAALVLGGYCLGGLLALGLSVVRQDLIDGIALFATPWDFTTPPFPGMSLNEEEIQSVSDYIDNAATISAETLQHIFHLAHPQAVLCKLRKYTSLNKDEPISEEFMAVEHWVNNGLPMVRGVAKDCFIHFMQHNSPYNKLWRVGGHSVNPATINKPSFIAIAEDDTIVPMSSALPLCELLKNNTFVTAKTGHIGMMVGHRRNAALWNPFSKWIRRQYA